MPSDIELVIRVSKTCEAALEARFGATGKGLHEKTSSVEHRLDSKTVSDLRYIATARNKLLHDDATHDLSDRRRFENIFERVQRTLGVATEVDQWEQASCSETEATYSKPEAKFTLVLYHDGPDSYSSNDLGLINVFLANGHHSRLVDVRKEPSCQDTYPGTSLPFFVLTQNGLEVLRVSGHSTAYEQGKVFRKAKMKWEAQAALREELREAAKLTSVIGIEPLRPPDKPKKRSWLAWLLGRM